MAISNFIGDYPTLQEASIAKNYLTEKELDVLNRIVSLYLDFAELQALEENPMTMKDWVEQLDDFLKMSRKDILKNHGKISHAKALEKAKNEYQVYQQNLNTTLSNVDKSFIETIEKLENIEKRKD